LLLCAAGQQPRLGGGNHSATLPCFAPLRCRAAAPPWRRQPLGHASVLCSLRCRAAAPPWRRQPLGHASVLCSFALPGSSPALAAATTRPRFRDKYYTIGPAWRQPRPTSTRIPIPKNGRSHSAPPVNEGPGLSTLLPEASRLQFRSRPKPDRNKPHWLLLGRFCR